MTREFPDSQQRRAICEKQSRAASMHVLDMVCEPGAITIECSDGGGPAGGSSPLPRFSMVAYTGGAMRVAGWRHPVVVDLGGLLIPSQSRPVRFGHDMLSGVGHTDSIRIEGGQLIASGVVSRDTHVAREVVASARNGFPWQASIGVSVEEFEFVKEHQKVLVNGREYSGPVNVVRKATLGEISFVDLGADQATSAQLVASAPLEKECVMEDVVHQSQQEAEQVNAQEAPSKVTGEARQDVTASWEIEVKRIAMIREICQGKHPDIEAKAIEEDWTPKQTALAVLRASRAPAPAIQVRREPEGFRHLEAAACLKYGVPERIVVRDYGEQVCEQASRYRTRGIQWMAQHIAAQRGVELEGTPGSAQWVRAAFSLNELSGIIGAVANKALGAVFEAAPATVPRIASAVSHTTFHTYTVYSLAVNGELQPVAPDGELKHLALGEESYTRQLSTRGAVLSVTRTDLINDDLGALTRTATAMAQRAIIAREKAMYSLINSTGNGTSFFTAGRGNYFDGAASALSADSLATAVQKFRDQTDPSGMPLLIEPRILLVPSSLEVAAKRLMSAQTFIATGVGSSRQIEGAQNIWEGAFEVVVSPMLNNSAMGGSSTAWYLIADPAVLPCFEIAYLNGNQTPTVEFFGLDHDANRLGVTYRVYWDFGAALAEYRAGVKSKGAA